MDLNVKSVFFLTQQLLPLLRKSLYGRIINIGSIDGTQKLKIPGIKPTTVEHYAYSSSKAAVHMLTKVLASRLLHEGITVNAIAPGTRRLISRTLSVQND